MNPHNPGSRHIIAFGGDLLQADPVNKLSANYVLGLTGRERPRVCFLPTASGDYPPYVESFYARYSPDLCEASHLTLFNRTAKELRAFLLANDIIYVGGGNTANMFAIWKVHGVDEILCEAHEQGIILCGTSAGSICWFEASVTDSFSPDLDPFYGPLGFLRGSNCPHYNTEPNRQPQYHKFIREGMPAGYAADDGAALHFVGGQLHAAVSSVEGARAFRVELTGSEVIETPLAVRFLGD